MNCVALPAQKVALPSGVTLLLLYLSSSGLQVVLYIDEADYNPFLVTSTGAKIIVHDQDEYPFIEDIGTEIETAAATSIGMHFVSDSNPMSFCPFVLRQG